MTGTSTGAAGIGNTLNVIVAGLVGAAAATALTVGGVNAYKGDQTPVAESQLIQYSEQ